MRNPRPETVGYDTGYPHDPTDLVMGRGGRAKTIHYTAGPTAKPHDLVWIRDPRPICGIIVHAYVSGFEGPVTCHTCAKMAGGKSRQHILRVAA